MVDFENPPSKILVKCWAGEKLAHDTYLKFCDHGVALALSEAESWVGSNPTRTATIIRTQTENGIFIVRRCALNDAREPGNFFDRCKVLADRLNAMD